MPVKKIIVVAFLFFAIGLMQQSVAQTMKFKIKNLPDTTVYLVKYYGANLYFADTVKSKKGLVVFDGSKHHAGMYAVMMPNNSYFEFMYDKEPVFITISDFSNRLETAVIKKSQNNQIFYDYMRFMTVNHQKMIDLNKKYEGYSKGTPQYDSLVTQIDVIYAQNVTYQDSILTTYPDLLVTDLLKMAFDFKFPDYPRDSNGNVLDSTYKYKYYLNHYWDGVDLSDPRIVYSPMYFKKLDTYFSNRGIGTNPDTIIKYSYQLLEKMNQVDQDNKVFQYTLNHLVYKYDTTRLMGMDKILWFYGVNYYCPPNDKVYWASDADKKKYCDYTEKIGKSLIGNLAVPLILTDTSGNWINFYDIAANYTVLYFWSPSCGHCKTSMPKLQMLYEKKLKARGIEIYAVADATGPDFTLWKNFIHDNNLTFTNVALTRPVYDQAMIDPRPLLQYTTGASLNYADTYDVYSTPKIFVLDKDKRVLYKEIGLTDLERVMDYHTGHEGDERLIFE
jgi:thiol-disulfide isomerase/thioredoxin